MKKSKHPIGCNCGGCYQAYPAETVELEPARRSEECCAPLAGYTDYPDESEGTRMAREIRAKCNHLTAEERNRLLKRGLELINATQKSV